MKKIKDRGDFRLRKELSQKRYVTSAICTFVIIFLLWTLLCASGQVKELFLPSPAKVVKDIIESAKDGTLWVNMGYSIFRITMGFIISTVIESPFIILAKNIPITLVANTYITNPPQNFLKNSIVDSTSLFLFLLDILKITIASAKTTTINVIIIK